MKISPYAIVIAMLLPLFIACDDNIDAIGASLNSDDELLDVTADTFDVTSRTVIAAPAIARSNIGYLGRMYDPETKTLITGNIMTQFHVLENYQLPDKKTISSLEDGDIIADSCDVRLFYNTYAGDSLSQLKVTVYEMGKPMEESADYYTDFDPISEGYIRTNGIAQTRTYTLYDLTETDDVLKSSGYSKNIRIALKNPYQRDGITYNNFGTYLMRQYYINPANFRNSYLFAHNILPGFFYKIVGGIGSMAHIVTAQINIYYRTTTDGKEKNVTTSLTSTEEVLLTTSFEYDKEAIASLASEDTWTYLKSPAGLYTEVTLPIEKMVQEHSTDSINGAKLYIPRINSKSEDADNWSAPKQLLMIPVDSLDNFFQKNKIADNKFSFLSSEFSSDENKYKFDNISGLINRLYNVKKAGKASENWNKVYLIPVKVSYGYNANNTKIISRIDHDFSLSSTRLVGGESNSYEPLRISVVYSKFRGR